MRTSLLLAIFSLGALFASANDFVTDPVCNETKTKNRRDERNQSNMEPVCSSLQYENNVFVETDFIYWLAKQEGNNYAATGAAITVPGTTDPNTALIPGALHSGNVYSPDTQMAPGFKAGIGVNLEYGGWDLFAKYTFLHSKASGSVQSNNLNAGIIPTFIYSPNNSILAQTTFESGATGFVSKANSNWYLHFNNMNVELGKVFPTTLSAILCLHAHFGLQTSWQTQHLSVNYDVSSFTTPVTPLGNNQVTFHQDFWGVGPRAGFDTDWKCYKHIGLFANTAFSALWGQFKSRGKSYDTNFSSYKDVLIANQFNSFYTLSPVMELELGVQSDWVIRDQYHFLVRAGWEAQVWFFQNQHSSIIADTSLILQGLTVDFRFDF